MVREDKQTEDSKIYDKIYGHIASREKYKIKNSTKSSRIEKILMSLEYDERTALRCCCRYSDIDMAVKISKIPKKKLMRDYKIARRHMYAPNSIRIAIPKFYKIKVNHEEVKLHKEDFGNQSYIMTALEKSGIDTREKLFKHISLGWYYLWTIPGCGDGARQSILMAIDKWFSEDYKNE